MTISSIKRHVSRYCALLRRISKSRHQMHTVVITGWEVGFLKVAHTKLLQEAAVMSLSDAKAATDSVLEGKAVSIPVATEVEAEDLVLRLRQLKAIAHVARSALQAFSRSQNMPLPRVYVDFNAIEYLAEEPLIAELALTGYGTLASLARQKLRLEEGMHVLIYEPDDIECEAIVHFDASRHDPAGRAGEWVARIEHAKIRNSTEQEHPGRDFPCIGCGNVFVYDSPTATRNYQEVCVACGASVMEPLAPPKNAV